MSKNVNISNKHKLGEPPDIVFIQWYGDSDPELMSESEKKSIDPTNGSVSWCWEEIFPSDIQYVRKEKYDEAVAVLLDLVNYVKAELMLTEGQIQYSTNQINRVAFKANVTLTKHGVQQ